jgi:osmotically-inducible protein OsmY
MASRYSNDEDSGRGSRGDYLRNNPERYGRGRSEQHGYDEERWRRNQDWSPSQDREYQTGGYQDSPYGYGGSGREYGDSDAYRFRNRSGDYSPGGGSGDFRSHQAGRGGQGGFGTSQYGYGGSGSTRDYSGPSLGGYGEGEFNRREMRQSRYEGGYGSQGTGYREGQGSYGQGQYGGEDFGRERNSQGLYGSRGYGSQGAYESSDADLRGGYGSSTGQYGLQQGGFRGRGPKGYTRSDQRIEEDVNERLSDDYYLDASNIEVSVQGGTVTLSGEVEDRDAKRRAEDLAESCSGVQQVQNNIKVQSGGLTGWLFGNGSDENLENSTTASTQSGTSTKKASSSGS